MCMKFNNIFNSVKVNMEFALESIVSKFRLFDI